MSIKALLEKITDENLRKEIEEKYDDANRKAGEHGRKLIEKDQELDNLRKEKKEVSEWSKYFDILKKKGMKPEDIPAVLEKMEVHKTTEDEYKVMKALYSDLEAKNKDLAKENNSFKVRGAVDKFFVEARNNFKDKDGKVVTFVDEFIDTGKLYADVSDLSNEVLLKERVDTVLKDAFQKQESIKQKFGFQGAATHKVPEAGQSGQGVTQLAQLQELAGKEGLVAAVSEYYRLQKEHKA